MQFFEKTAEKAFAADSHGDLPEWDLTDLYSAMDGDDFRRDFNRIAGDSEAFQKRYSGQLETLAKDSPDSLGEAIEFYERLEEVMGRLMSYAGLVYSSDTSNPKNSKFYGDVQERITSASSHLLFFTLELNRLDQSVIEVAMKKSPRLANYQPWIRDLQKDKPYQLEDRIEQLFHEKATSGRMAWNRLFDETMASLRFDIGGESLSIEPALNCLQSTDRAKRVEAAKEIGRILSENGRLFTLITNTLAKDKEISDRWHGFKNPPDSRHLANRIEPKVVNALVEAVEAHFPLISHRYYDLKAKWLGLEKLSHWDRNAPLTKVDEPAFSWPEAKRIVLDAYSGFSPEMAKIADRFFERNWIDAPVRPGKSPGAFAHPTVPSVHPYVMLNYLGKPRDVMTLAHELGHGVHQVLAADQGLLKSQTPLTLAETASVFGEMLTFQSILERAENVDQRRLLLARKVEDMINTVVRQIAFYLFEREVHLKRRDGELTEEELAEIWLDVQRRSLGPAFEFDDSYGSYWSYIPHFIHAPFYVYAYAFGDCLVNSLFSVYQQAENGFEDRYFEMLRAGGTKHHSELLAPFGLSASDSEFWQKGLSVITAMIDELETLEDGGDHA